jgi:hypothetical protein
MHTRRARSSYPVRRTAQRRRTLWAVTGTNATAVTSGSLSTVGIVADQMVAGVGIIGGTILRVHLRLSLSSPTTDTAPGATYGVIVWDTSLAKPDPASDLEIPWMHWAFISPGTSCGPVVISSSVLYGETVDMRAKRKLPQTNDRLFFLLHNDGSATVTYSLATRVLVALP